MADTLCVNPVGRSVQAVVGKTAEAGAIPARDFISLRSSRREEAHFKSERENGSEPRYLGCYEFNCAASEEF